MKSERIGRDQIWAIWGGDNGARSFKESGGDLMLLDEGRKKERKNHRIGSKKDKEKNKKL